ncbi:hypothetical protein ABH925_006503 [Streptacidiphilus sp. EB129]|jgi:hypothetical protein
MKSAWVAALPLANPELLVNLGRRSVDHHAGNVLSARGDA